MSTSSFIRRFINQLAEGQMFTTRDLLCFGSRTSVDQCLRNLLRKEKIERLARGVFMRGDQTTPRPTEVEIAMVKAAAFGKELSIHGDDLAAKFKLPSSPKSDTIKFWVNGSSASEFKIGKTKVILKPASARMIRLVKQAGPALSLAALSHLGKKKVTRTEILMTATFSNHERQQLKESLKEVPQWLSKFYLK